MINFSNKTLKTQKIKFSCNWRPHNNTLDSIKLYGQLIRPSYNNKSISEGKSAQKKW